MDLTADERVARVSLTEDWLVVALKGGRVIVSPLAWYPRLLHATPAQRKNWEITGGGHEIHWSDLDERLSTPGLLRELATRSQTFRRVAICTGILCLVLYFALPILLTFRAVGLQLAGIALLTIAAAAAVGIAYALKLAPLSSSAKKQIIVCVLASLICAAATFYWTDKVVRSWPPPPWGYGGDVMHEHDAIIVIVAITGLPVAVATFNVLLIAALSFFSRKLRPGWMAATVTGVLFALAPLWIRAEGYQEGWELNLASFFAYCSPPFISIILFRRIQVLLAKDPP